MGLVEDENRRDLVLLGEPEEPADLGSAGRGLQIEAASDQAEEAGCRRFERPSFFRGGGCPGRKAAVSSRGAEASLRGRARVASSFV